MSTSIHIIDYDAIPEHIRINRYIISEPMRASKCNRSATYRVECFDAEGNNLGVHSIAKAAVVCGVSQKSVKALSENGIPTKKRGYTMQQVSKGLEI